MKVVYVISQCGKRSDGGVQSISLAIDALAERGLVEPIIVTNTENDRTAHWRTKNYEVLTRPFGLFGSTSEHCSATPYDMTPQIHLDLREILLHSQAKIIHCNDPIATWHAAWTGRACQTKVITHIRDTRNLKNDYLSQISRKISDTLIVLSHEMKTIVESEIAGQCPIEVIYSLVGPGMWAKSEKDRRQRTRTIAIVGQLQPKKKQLEVLKFLQGNREQLGDLNLHFAGDLPSETVPYQRECREIGETFAERVSFVGYQEDMGAWYRTMDVVLVASEHEGLVRAMIESLACGVPVISTDVCSAHEVLTKHNCGFVHEKEDFVGLFRDALLLSKWDSLRVDMGTRGVKTTESLFSPESLIPQYEDLYSKLENS